MKGRVKLDTKIKKMRERLEKQRLRVAEEEAKAAEIERDIKKAEEEQLGYLARSAANSLSGGMEELFALLRDIKSNPGAASGNSAASEPVKNPNEIKEGKTVDDDTDETEEANA